VPPEVSPTAASRGRPESNPRERYAVATEGKRARILRSPAARMQRHPRGSCLGGTCGWARRLSRSRRLRSALPEHLFCARETRRVILSCFLAVRNRAVLSARLAVLAHFSPQRAEVTFSLSPRSSNASALVDFSRSKEADGRPPPARRVRCLVACRAHACFRSRGVLGDARPASSFCIMQHGVLRSSTLRCLARSDVGRPARSGAACTKRNTTPIDFGCHLAVTASGTTAPRPQGRSEHG